MLYPMLFLVRYFPFWAIPLALVMFEVGTYHHNRRERIPTVFFFGLCGSMVITSILWLIFEGYWRAGPFIKRTVESF